MKKTAFFLSLIAFLLPQWPLSAQSTTAASAESSLLWRVTGKGIEAPSYVFGTIHMIGADDFFWPEGLKDAFKKTDKLVLEINIGKAMEDPATMMAMMKGMMMADGSSLSTLLSEADYEKVKTAFAKAGVPLMMVERMKPLFASAMLQEQGLQTEGVKSYELELMKLAEALDVPLDELETIEFQMSMFDKIPYADQAKMLVESVGQDGEEADAMFDKLVQSYKAQDVDALYAGMAEQMSEYEGFDDLMLVQRNQNWIPVMQDMMAQGPVFFAVGAGHLGGEQGVLALLRAQGYTLEPIRAAVAAE